MFIENKYWRIYNTICSRAISRVTDGYTERHHILPRSLGGGNEETNLVQLTAREHFIAHVCLTKCTTGEARKKMIAAVLFFKSRGDVISGRSYQRAKEEYSELMKGHKINLGRKYPNRKSPIRKPLTEETKRKIADAHKGRKLSEEHRIALGRGKIGNKNRLGTHHSEETKILMSQKVKNNSANISSANSTRLWTPEMREKMSKSIRAANERRKQANA